jgi:hypothetical protein
VLNASRLVAIALAGVILGLLAVGVVSGTPVRHIIQALPATTALILVNRRVAGSYYAALPVFVIWLLAMLSIWLFLLGIARVTSGTFTPAEIALTLVIGAACVLGLSQTFRQQPPANRMTRLGWAIAFTALQVAAIWLSLRPAIERM